MIKAKLKMPNFLGEQLPKNYDIFGIIGQLVIIRERKFIIIANMRQHQSQSKA